MATPDTLLVMSDSHGDRAVVADIKQRYIGTVTALFHNGDSELDSSDSLWEGIQVVKGNCDYGGGFPERLITQVGAIRVAQTHGHLFGINYSCQRLDYWAQEEEADICLYGHLHIPDACMRGKTLFVNPGSVLQPRGLVAECLYALISVYPDRFVVEYYTRDHVPYPDLRREFQR